MHFIIGLKVSRIFQTSYGSRQKKAYNAFERSETSLTARINFVFLLLIWHWACQWCIEFAKCTRNELTFSASNIWSGNQIVCLCQEEFDYNAIIISFCKLVIFMVLICKCYWNMWIGFYISFEYTVRVTQNCWKAK